VAIYAGNWRDGSGVPFDPGAFATPAGRTGQRAQVRRFDRIASTAQQTARALFSNVMHFFGQDLTPAERADWQYEADLSAHPTRLMVSKDLEAPALYATSQIMQAARDFSQEPFEPDFPAPVLPWTGTFEWFTRPTVARFAIANLYVVQGPPNSGIIAGCSYPPPPGHPTPIIQPLATVAVSPWPQPTDPTQIDIPVPLDLARYGSVILWAHYYHEHSWQNEFDSLT